MEKLIYFYENFGHIVDAVFLYFGIVVATTIGTEAFNRFNRSNEKDLKGADRLVAIMFMSLLIYFGLSWTKRIGLMIITSLVFGLSGDKLIKKLYKNKVWDKYDFISRGDNKDDKE